MKKRALIGAGGFARELMAHMNTPNMVCFVDDCYWSENENNVLPLSEFNPYDYEVLVAIGDSEQRFNMVSKLPSETSYFSFIHESVKILGDDVIIDNGSVVCAGCILTTNVKIGKHAQLNLNTTIGHDCKIGDFFTTAPAVNLSGNCKIGNLVYLGTNCSVKQNISITDNVIIGLNAGVVSNINIPGTYVGLPAKIINRRKKLSVVITCYNFEKYISTCIDSVLEQKTNFDMEIIVADDCSQDSSYDIIKSYGEKIRHYRNETNIGCFENLKKALEISESDYISHIDGDDYFTDPLKSQKQVDFLESNPDYSMHSTGSFFGFEDGTPNYGALMTPLYDTINYNDLINSNYVSFGRTFRNYKNIMKEWMKDVYYLDWAFNLEFSFMGKIKCEKWVSGIYRLTGNGMITSKTEEEIHNLNNKSSELIRNRIEYHKNYEEYK